jgi:hypothetical protein
MARRRKNPRATPTPIAALLPVDRLELEEEGVVFPAAEDAVAVKEEVVAEKDSADVDGVLVGEEDDVEEVVVSEFGLNVTCSPL